jgi:predicted ATPase with chaperone activity
MSVEWLADHHNAMDPLGSDEGPVIHGTESLSLVSHEGVVFPLVPNEVSKTGVDRQILLDLVVRLGAQVPTVTTDWVARQTRLPLQMAQELLSELKDDQLIEVMGQVGLFNHKYTLTSRGRDYAEKSSQHSGYVGAAPVSLSDYRDFLLYQQQQLPPITEDKVRRALADLVIPDHAIRVAALAAASFRSLFVFGPPGNGKTSMGSMLHKAFEGGLWIPYCLSIEHHVIRIFDPQVHEALPPPTDLYDQRWVYIRRPFLVVGGELTLEDLDLSFNATTRNYEAPAHLKANGGTFLVDDLGRQRAAATELLNRWIIPLERHVDYLTLNTGQRVSFPFHLMLIVATNLTTSDIRDEAFLRRMGYRLELPGPDKDGYLRILTRYAQQIEARLDPEIPHLLVDRYQREGRPFRASEPRDILERARDYCRLVDQPLHVNQEVLDIAWRAYFGVPPARG